MHGAAPKATGLRCCTAQTLGEELWEGCSDRAAWKGPERYSLPRDRPTNPLALEIVLPWLVRCRAAWGANKSAVP